MAVSPSPALSIPSVLIVQLFFPCDSGIPFHYFFSQNLLLCFSFRTGVRGVRGVGGCGGPATYSPCDMGFVVSVDAA